MSLWSDNAVGELVHHLRELVRIDTSNPPGGESEAAHYIRQVFEREGIGCDVLEAIPGRGNIVARIRGTGLRPPLLLMGHLDVVPVVDTHWSVNPFAAEIRDGQVWGRGTLDCKNTVALWMMAMILLQRSGLKPNRDLIFLATADEENDHLYGMAWMVKNHYDLIDAEAALNEGGGFSLSLMGKTFVTYQNAEKGNIWLRITAYGKSGHASIPSGDNPLILLADLISRLVRHPFALLLTRSVRHMLLAMAKSYMPHYLPVDPLGLLLRPRLLKPLLSLLSRLNPHLADKLHAMMHNTLTPTIFLAGHKTNVRPDKAYCEIDFRLLPCCDLEATIQQVSALIGGDFEIEVLGARAASESAIQHPLVDAMRRSLAHHQPNAELVPFLLPGITDACFLRPKGMNVYGFTPLLPQDDPSLIHGNDERVSLDSLQFGLKVTLETICDYIF